MNGVVKLTKLIVSQIKIKPRFYSIKIKREEKEGHEKRVRKRGWKKERERDVTEKQKWVKRRDGDCTL